MNYVEIAIPFFIPAMGLEFLYGALVGRQTYRLNDTINSLALGVLSRLKGFCASAFRRWRSARCGVPRRFPVVDGFGRGNGR